MLPGSRPMKWKLRLRNEPNTWPLLRANITEPCKRRETRATKSGTRSRLTNAVKQSCHTNLHGMTKSLHELAIATEQNLWEIKLTHRPKSFWYPYSTLHNVAVLEKLCAAAGLNLLELRRGERGKVADIGAADGDLAFFLERQGLTVDAIDNEYTNFNGLEGARTLKQALNSSVAIRSVDLDSQFSLAGQKYDAVFFLGTLYHLKNPFFLLESLARITKYCFLSTRIAKQTADGQSLSAY